MQANALLTQDELDFIRHVHRSPQFKPVDGGPSLRLKGGTEINQLLKRLAAQEQVTLEAQFDNQQMRFPLHLIEDEFHAVHLQLGAPSIYEDGPMMRPWRLTLDEPSALIDDLGLSTDLRVREISFKGVLLEVPRGADAPKTFSLWFDPEGDAPISLQGTLQRRTADGLAAYRLSQRQPQEIERLRQYILKEHRRAHPDLHCG